MMTTPGHVQWDRLQARVRALVWVPLLMAGASGAVLAQAPLPGQTPDEQTPLSWPGGTTRTMRIFPAGEIYPVYVADPHRTTNAIAPSFYTHMRLPDSRSPRTFLAVGGHFGMLRIEPAATGGRFWQISLDAGMDALFDSQFKNDAIGWDGNYGLTITTAADTSRLGFKVAVLHVSAHLGDEYEERTDTGRINYTREELALGAGWRFHPRWRAYGEVGIAYILRSERQEPLRWQSGLEYEGPPALLGGRIAWYGAVDLSSLEERDWRVDSAFEGGLVTRSGGHAYRLFAKWYDGRPTVGQFATISERSFALGFKFDL
jgi:hypothetical protein